MIRRGEKDCGLQGMGDVLMRGKLLSVVERLNQVPAHRQHRRYGQQERCSVASAARFMAEMGHKPGLEYIVSGRRQYDRTRCATVNISGMTTRPPPEII
jgi:hypothetical protein